jgi:D-glycero-alpha-D-manno-heptose-7-phosphate kinase
LYNLEDNLLLFFTGYSRSASSILKEQDDKSKQSDQAMIENLHFIKELGYQSKVALEQGNLREFAELMNVHWRHKKGRSGGMSNADIDQWYELALRSGALGGKLIGAGGGGFLMFYTEDKTRLRHAMAQTQLREVRFRFDFEGTKVVTQ